MSAAFKCNLRHFTLSNAMCTYVTCVDALLATANAATDLSVIASRIVCTRLKGIHHTD